MGRRPTAGVACDEHGYIVVDDQLRTNVLSAGSLPHEEGGVPSRAKIRCAHHHRQALSYAVFASLE
jgi:hypothetical protein